MTSPVRLDWKIASQLYLPSDVSSLVKNVGRTPIYLSTSDGVTSLSYDFVLLPGASVEWNGNTRIFAITNDGDYGYIAIITDSHFIFEGTHPTYWEPALYPYANYSLPPNATTNFPSADASKRYFEVGNAVELQISAAFSGNTTPNDSNPFVSVILKWYNSPDLSDTPVNEEYICTINSLTNRYNAALLGYEPEMYHIKSSPKGKYVTIQMLNWLAASSVALGLTIQFLSQRTTTRERLLTTPDQGFAPTPADSNGLQFFSNPSSGQFCITGNYAASASRGYLLPPMPGHAKITIGNATGTVFAGLYSMAKDSTNVPYWVTTAGAGTYPISDIILPNTVMMLLLINNSGAGVVANGIGISIISDDTKA